MDRDQFWQVISDSRRRVGNTADGVAARIVARLQHRPLAEIVAFGRQYDAVSAESRRPLLWAAAYLINGGCSDDGFAYFRGWLVTRGRDMWTQAIADPDSLANVVHSNRFARVVRAIKPLECEDMLGAASEAYERAGGDGESYWQALAEMDDSTDTPMWPDAEWFDFDDGVQMRARLPRLSARLLT